MQSEIVGGVERETSFTPLGEAILECRSCNKELLYVLEHESGQTRKNVYASCPYCKSKSWKVKVNQGLKLSCHDKVCIVDYNISDTDIEVILLKK